MCIHLQGSTWCLANNPEDIASCRIPDEINTLSIPMVVEMTSLNGIVRNIWVEETHTIPIPTYAWVGNAV